MAALHQIDYEFYTDDVSVVGRYYWTQTYYHADSFTNPTSGPTWNATLDFYAALQPVGVTMSGIHAQRLDPVPQDYGVSTIPVAGARSVSSPLQLLLVPRIVWLSSGKPVGYKRLRLPMADDEYYGGEVDSGYISLLSGAITTLIGASDLCNWKGVPIDGFLIRPEVRPWDIRHGTKRAARAVIT